MKEKLAVAAALALLAWLLGRPEVKRRAQEIEINADVYSPHFGEPITDTLIVQGDADAANHQRLIDLVDESNRAIAEFDRTHPETP